MVASRIVMDYVTTFHACSSPSPTVKTVATDPVIGEGFTHEFANGLQVAVPVDTDVASLEKTYDEVFGYPLGRDKERLEQGDVVVDVGAGVGIFGIYCESLFETTPALHLLAIQVDGCDNDERNSRLFEALELNVRRFNSESVCVRTCSPCMRDILALVSRQCPSKPISLLRLDVGSRLGAFLDLSDVLEWNHVQQVMLRCTTDSEQLNHVCGRLEQIGFSDVQHVALDDIWIVLASKR